MVVERLRKKAEYVERLEAKLASTRVYRVKGFGFASVDDAKP